MQDGARFRWSVLPPVLPFGIGTELVESAEHYAARLAWISGSSVPQICRLSFPGGDGRRDFVGGANRFCGPGSVYKQRIASLESLTGVDTIRCGTFMVLDKVLCDGAAGGTTGYRRWCPECYLNWDEDDSWEPLVWHVDLVKSCPIHGCDLQDSCCKCGNRQKQVVAYHRRRRCTRCGASLGWPGRFGQRPSYYAWAQTQICDLARMCGTPGEEPVHPLAVSEFVYAIPAITAHRRKIPGVVRDALARSKTRTRHVASLETIVSLCGLQGVRATDMLRNPVGAASRPLLDLWSGERMMEVIGAQAPASGLSPPRRHRQAVLTPR